MHFILSSLLWLDICIFYYFIMKWKKPYYNLHTQTWALQILELILTSDLYIKILSFVLFVISYLYIFFYIVCKKFCFGTFVIYDILEQVQTAQFYVPKTALWKCKLMDIIKNRHLDVFLLVYVYKSLYV